MPIRSASSPRGSPRRRAPACPSPRPRPWPRRPSTERRRCGWCSSSRPTTTASCSSPTTRAARATSSPPTPAPHCCSTGNRLGRQVRIEGPIERTTREQSEAYAHSRGRGSQLSAMASPQSRTIESRDVLEQRVSELAERYAGGDIPLSDTMGRLPPHARDVRVLAAPRQSPARPAPLPARTGRGLANRTARTLAPAPSTLGVRARRRFTTQ